MPAKSSRLARSGVALLLGAAAWESCSPSTFVGTRAPVQQARTAMNGYRFDWMLEGKNGEKGLQTTDGYWVGEVGFEKAMGAQGYRYRMRPTSKEMKEGKEIDGLIFQFGPLKVRLGEAFGGTGNNEALRVLKKKLVAEGMYDKAKIAENEYWKKRFGHNRWEPSYIDQSNGLPTNGLFRGLAAWSGIDPLKEEKGKTWFEADYGKPWLKKYVGFRLPGFVSAEQVKREYDSGKLLKK
mmetsp:Transcript_55261/g.142342  ORF Transcript_55261/g.142342 Transcript_55261/m.142342 type:complete len:238 (+) Transcript_55261:83-796(+)